MQAQSVGAVEYADYFSTGGGEDSSQGVLYITLSILISRF